MWVLGELSEKKQPWQNIVASCTTTFFHHSICSGRATVAQFYHRQQATHIHSHSEHLWSRILSPLKKKENQSQEMVPPQHWPIFASREAPATWRAASARFAPRLRNLRDDEVPHINFVILWCWCCSRTSSGCCWSCCWASRLTVSTQRHSANLCWGYCISNSLRSSTSRESCDVEACCHKTNATTGRSWSPYVIGPRVQLPLSAKEMTDCSFLESSSVHLSLSGDLLVPHWRSFRPSLEIFLKNKDEIARQVIT